METYKLFPYWPFPENYFQGIFVRELFTRSSFEGTFSREQIPDIHESVCIYAWLHASLWEQASRNIYLSYAGITVQVQLRSAWSQHPRNWSDMYYSLYWNPNELRTLVPEYFRSLSWNKILPDYDCTDEYKYTIQWIRAPLSIPDSGPVTCLTIAFPSLDLTKFSFVCEETRSPILLVAFVVVNKKVWTWMFKY
jgi:hypothetical protein